MIRTLSNIIKQDKEKFVIPKSVQQAIPIQTIWKDGIFTNIAINVPTTLPIIFNEDGTNTYPTNWEIQNVGVLGCVCLKNVEMEATDAGWILLDEKVDTSKLPVDTKSVKFKMGTEGALRVVNPRTSDNPSLGLMYLEDDELTIPAGESKLIQFEVERGAFSEDISNRTTFNIILKFKYI